MKKIERPAKYRGRVFVSSLQVWRFADGSGTLITEEQRQDELNSLPDMQKDNMRTAYKMFNPNKDWPRR